MTSIAADFAVLIALLALCAFVVFGTLGINRNRRLRTRSRRITARLLDWK